MFPLPIPHFCRSIKAYMKTRTYLDKDDPRFWHKLLYEMPDQGLGETRGNEFNPERQLYRLYMPDSDSDSSLSGGWDFDQRSLL